MNTAYKYHGAGNDFIILDFFANEQSITGSDIQKMCNRRTGIGADGLILIKKSDTAEFKMEYFNSDGPEAEMCGNGARCAMAFAYSKKYCTAVATFEASDGIHHGIILQDNTSDWLVKINLRVSSEPRQIIDGSYFVNTGVPHNVRVVDDTNIIDVRTSGAELRYNKLLFPEGANINFISLKQDCIERGVEDETLACGTGITASALVAKQYYGYRFPLVIHAQGGTLRVDEQDGLLWLEGPAKHVFTASLQ